MCFVFCNEGAKKYFGSDPTGKNIWVSIPKLNKPFIIEKYQRALHRHEPLYFEMQSVFCNRWVGINLYPANDGGLSVFFRDIHEIKQADERVRKANERFLKAFNLNPNIMLLISCEESTILDVNKAFLELGGLDRKDIVGKKWFEINSSTPKKQRDQIVNYFRHNGNISNYEIEYYPGGVQRVGLVSAEIIELNDEKCVIVVITDITEKRRMEEEIFKYDRLNFVGEIAASIGHEVRNPMTTVRGYLQMFQRKQQFSNYIEDIGVMIEELDRANGIITEFLSLAKNKTFELKKNDLTAIIKSIFPLIKADALRLEHTIQTKLQSIPTLMLDEKEIRQLVLNLVRNAFEAIEEAGIVFIKTYHNQSYAFLEVADNGRGIPSQILNRLGTPFLTTKENGTGLGLAVCYRVVQRHNAKMSVNTNAKGTTFVIKFPIPSTLVP